MSESTFACQSMDERNELVWMLALALHNYGVEEEHLCKVSEKKFNFDLRAIFITHQIGLCSIAGISESLRTMFSMFRKIARADENSVSKFILALNGIHHIRQTSKKIVFDFHNITQTVTPRCSKIQHHASSSVAKPASSNSNPYNPPKRPSTSIKTSSQTSSPRGSKVNTIPNMVTPIIPTTSKEGWKEFGAWKEILSCIEHYKTPNSFSSIISKDVAMTDMCGAKPKVNASPRAAKVN